MKVLVTGATGFIGNNLVQELVKRGYEVTCLVRSNSRLRCLEGFDLNIVHGDCTDKDSLKRLSSDFSYVFHLAGLTKAKKEKDFFLTNGLGTENLLNVLSERTHHIKRFLYLSSLAAVGPSRERTPLDETATPGPVSLYGRSKLEGEQATLRYKDRIAVTVIRPPAVYGPHDRDFFLFFKMVKRGFYPYWGKCYYSLLYVDDLVRGLITAVESPVAEDRIYFLSDGRIYSNEEIVREIMQAMDTKAVRLRIPASVMGLLANISEKFSHEATMINTDKIREIQHSHWTCNTKKAENELGFVPRVTLKQGIKWTADWYKIHKWI